jgi:hypothetical protein
MHRLSRILLDGKIIDKDTLEGHPLAHEGIRSGPYAVNG